MTFLYIKAGMVENPLNQYLPTYMRDMAKTAPKKKVFKEDHYNKGTVSLIRVNKVTTNISMPSGGMHQSSNIAKRDTIKR